MNEENNEDEANTIAEKRIAPVLDTVCITPNEYYGLMTAIVVLVVLLASIVLLTIMIYRYNNMEMKNTFLCLCF